MDFYQIKERSVKNGVIDIYPDFKVCRSKDLMVRGRSFYAIWDEEKGLWSTDEYDVQRLVDADLISHREKTIQKTDGTVLVKLMSDFSTKSWTEFRNYMKNVSDNSHQLDTKLTFSNTEVKKKDHVSRRLSYPLEGGKYEAFDELIGTLYDPEERAKLEWAIGAIVSGDAKDIQKFIVLYGEMGSGKSTIINVIQKLFEGYYTAFEAKALTSSNNAFSTEVFKSNPLVAIQHDGDLSKIEDNTKLNSIISHEEMQMNEKFKPSYMARINAFLFMGTNKPVKITDSKSGIIRRLIDVKPSGRKIPAKKYQSLVAQIDFELGAVASHCLDVYRDMGKNYYSSYRPLDMMLQTDVFFNFVECNFNTFKEQDGVSLSQAYEMYKTYCDEALIDYKTPRHKFREELRSYFKTFSEVARVNGAQTRSYYSGFLATKFTALQPVKEEHQNSLVLDCDESDFDKLYGSFFAQYASLKETPLIKWSEVDSILCNIDTRKLHYVKPPEEHIVIDFDLTDEKGNKSLEKNIEAASKWPPTYSEFSKGGAGIHLHYNYDGDVKKLGRLYSEGIEIKVFTGNSSLRRKLTKCNNVPIATINSGLPLKGETVINFDAVTSEKGIRALLKKNMRKEIHAGTKSSIDFIYKILDDAHKSGLSYDVTDMRPGILAFANNSSNQADYCIKLVTKMEFKSEEPSPLVETNNYVNGKSVKGYIDDELVFFDVEVFPNLFVIVYKMKGKKAVKLINPKPADIEALMKFKLVGFNCRRYDNHILYAAYIGHTNEQLYILSQRIIDNSRNCMFGEAYNISYTDVYDFASAQNKMSLKKWEIKLGIHHQELGLPWDQPVPEELWTKVAEYCINDVVATEAVFYHLAGDWAARQILAELSGLSVNDTTNQHSIRIVFGNNKKPQNELKYRDLSQPVTQLDTTTYNFLKENTALPLEFIGIDGGYSILPYFPGYKFENGKSTYRGIEVGEGGYVHGEPGMYSNVPILDAASMHPSTIEDEMLFGPYTQNYSDLKKARVAIKRKDFDLLKTLLGGRLIPFIEDARSENPRFTLKDVSNGLKTALNSAYGLTSASFENPFRDPRNVDNIVAKRGALFMIDLMFAVQERNFKAAHIKTDSIKIPNATTEIIEFVIEFGKKYGYDMEHEDTYNRFCLVNDAVYIAKTKDGEWSATGTQFAQPYVYKTLFSKEEITVDDMCETKSVTSTLYLDMNENLPEGEHQYHFVGKVGSFCPIKSGCGGGLLLREKEGKYYAATGSKGYRWLEAEMVKTLKKQDDIDKEYYIALVNDAISDISKFGDFEWFVSDDQLMEMKPDNSVPWFNPCKEATDGDCLNCPNWIHGSDAPNSCKLGYDCIPF